jgi:zinc protease
MLMRGTSRYDAQQLADAFERLKIAGSLTHFQTTREHLARRCAGRARAEGAELPGAEFEQLRQQWLVGLEASRNEPPAWPRGAGRALRPSIRRATCATMTRSTRRRGRTQGAKLDDVKAFHREFYGAVPAEMAIVGDFDAAAIKPLVDSCSAPGKQGPVRAGAAQECRHRAHRALNTPDKENGFYTARLNLDLNVDDPDYPALMLANYIFGDGGLKSRLMDRIRQKDGLSYGGGSQLSAGELDRAGAFSISAIAAPQNLAKLDARCARNWRARSRTASRRPNWRAPNRA